MNNQLCDHAMLRKEYGTRFISLMRRPISGRQKRTRLSAETGHIPGLDWNLEASSVRHGTSMPRSLVVS